ncbi:MAG: hypothetical protein ACK55I_13520, partial [bacterium]
TDPSNPIAYTAFVVAEVTADNTVKISHTGGGDIRFTNGTGNPITAAFESYDIEQAEGTTNFYASDNGSEYIATLWKPLSTTAYAASNDQPLAEPDDGQLWYNPDFSEVDIMIHNG